MNKVEPDFVNKFNRVRGLVLLVTALGLAGCSVEGVVTGDPVGTGPMKDPTPIACTSHTEMYRVDAGVDPGESYNGGNVESVEYVNGYKMANVRICDR